MVGVGTSHCEMVQLERIAPIVPRIRHAIELVEEEIVDFQSDLKLEVGVLEEFTTLVTDIIAEIDTATKTDNLEMDSSLIHGRPQRFEIEELRSKLKLRLLEMEEKHTTQKKACRSIEIQISNKRDDLRELNDQLEVETGKLMTHAQKSRRLRGLALNPANARGNDVMGQSTGGFEFICGVIGREIHVWRLTQGHAPLTCVRILAGDTEGVHLGELAGHSKLILAISCFETYVTTVPPS